MSFVTVAPHHDIRLPDKTVDAAPTRLGLWSRFFTALTEARMRAAQRELNRHLLPHELEQAGLKISYRNDDELPFVR